jgi:hypothetical protein
MEINKIKWDKSMEARCLGRLADIEAKAETGTVPVEGKSTYDKQWEEFERALDKALR